MAQCDIIQDLLPLYADKLTSETTNEMINQHIKQCGTCRKQLAYMQNPVDEINILENHDLKKALLKQQRKRRRRLFFTAASTLMLGILIACGFLYSKGYFSVITRSTSPDGSATCTIYDRNLKTWEEGILIRFQSDSTPDSEITIFDDHYTFDNVAWSSDSHYCLYSATGADNRTMLQILDAKNNSHINLDRLLDEAVAQSDYFDFIHTDTAKTPDMDYYNMHYRFYDWYDNDNVLISYHYGEHNGVIQYNIKEKAIQKVDSTKVEERRDFELDLPGL